MIDQIKNVIYAFSIGDALGLPYEGMCRKDIEIDDLSFVPTKFGGKGIYTDDTSLTLCTLETLTDGWDIHKLAELFVKWMVKGHNSSTGMAIGIGSTTRFAICNMHSGRHYNDWSLKEKRYNGNGALMRMLPVALYFIKHDVRIDQQLQKVKEIAEMTHGHIRSTLACYFQVRLCIHLYETKDLNLSISRSRNNLEEHLHLHNIEQANFRRIMNANFTKIGIKEIKSTGYVIDTLESVLWLLSNFNEVEDLAKQGISLGGDTDTITAIALGSFGFYKSPEMFINKYIGGLQNKERIDELVYNFAESKTELYV